MSNLTGYLNAVGTENKKFKAYRKEFQNLSASYAFEADEQYFYLKVDGEDDKIEKVIQLVNEIIESPEQDKSQISEIIEMAKSDMKFNLTSPEFIGKAMREYAFYKTASKELTKPTLKALKLVSEQDYLDLFKTVKSYPLTIQYVGNQKQIKKYLDETLNTKVSQKTSDIYDNRTVLKPTENTIHFINNKMQLKPIFILTFQLVIYQLKCMLK